MHKLTNPSKTVTHITHAPKSTEIMLHICHWPCHAALLQADWEAVPSFVEILGVSPCSDVYCLDHSPVEETGDVDHVALDCS